MDLSAIIARLQAQVTGLKSVGGAADLNAAINSVLAMPSAFVMPVREAASHGDTLQRTHQVISQTFGVVLVLSNKRDASGYAAQLDLAALRAQVKTALIGWIPSAASDQPTHFMGGQLLSMDGDGRLWWMDEFEFKTDYWSA